MFLYLHFIHRGPSVLLPRRRILYLNLDIEQSAITGEIFLLFLCVCPCVCAAETDTQRGGGFGVSSVGSEKKDKGNKHRGDKW